MAGSAILAMKMRECIPEWRWLEILRARAEQTPPTDEFLLRVYNVMHGVIADEDVAEAIHQWTIAYKRDLLTAFFLSKATYQQIHKGTWVRFEVLSVFEKLFIDPAQFKDKMDLRIYAQLYRDRNCQEENRPIINKAISEGPYSLMQYMATGNEVIKVPDEELATTMLMAACAKLSVASQEPLMSRHSGEALRWGKLATQLLTARNKLNPTPSDAEELMLDIKEREVTTIIGEDGVGFDLSHILH